MLCTTFFLPLHKLTIDPMKGPHRKSLCQVHVQMGQSVNSFRVRKRLFHGLSQPTNSGNDAGLVDCGGGLIKGHINNYCFYYQFIRWGLSWWICQLFDIVWHFFENGKRNLNRAIIPFAQTKVKNQNTIYDRKLQRKSRKYLLQNLTVKKQSTECCSHFEICSSKE